MLIGSSKIGSDHANILEYRKIAVKKGHMCINNVLFGVKMAALGNGGFGIVSLIFYIQERADYSVHK